MSLENNTKVISLNSQVLQINAKGLWVVQWLTWPDDTYINTNLPFLML